MAHPWIFQSNFETGSNAEWDSESDSASKLSFPHYSVLATIPGAPAPFRGAYCAMWDLTSGTTSDATVTEGDIDIADGGTAYFRWYHYVSSDFTASADDTFNFFELQETGNTREASLGFRITAASNLLEIGIGDGTAPTSFVQFPRGKWVCVELLATISTSDAGVLTLFLDGTQVATLGTLDNGGAITHGVFGTQDTLSTTTGRMFADSFVMDDARIYPHRRRFPLTVNLTKSAHVFVGPGYVDSAALMSTTAGNILRLYDTDIGSVLDAEGFVAEMTLDSHTSVAGPLQFIRGCYAQLSGTNPKGSVVLVGAHHSPGVHGPTHHFSDGAIKSYGIRRKPHQIGM